MNETQKKALALIMENLKITITKFSSHEELISAVQYNLGVSDAHSTILSMLNGDIDAGFINALLENIKE